MWTGYCKNTNQRTCLTRSWFCKLGWGGDLTRGSSRAYCHLQLRTRAVVWRTNGSGSFLCTWVRVLSKLPAVILRWKGAGNAHCFCTELRRKLCWRTRGWDGAAGLVSRPALAPEFAKPQSEQSGWFRVGVPVPFAFVLANNCAVFIGLVCSYPSVFYFDCDCIFGYSRMCDC